MLRLDVVDLSWLNLRLLRETAARLSASPSLFL